MAIAAHPLTLSVASADSGYAEVDGINDFSFGPKRDILESTNFKDTSGAKTRFAGLTDGAVSISGDYLSADTPQALIRTQEGNGGDLWVKVLWDGATGHKVKCIVESFTIKAAVAGKVEFSASLQMNGAVTSV